MTAPTEIMAAKTQAEYDSFTALVKQYLASLPFSTDFQDTKRELAEISLRYGEAGRGVALLAHSGHVAAGIVGLRDLGDGCCELKRMYVKPSWRGHGVGRLLCEAALQFASRLGCSSVRLDTLRDMDAAVHLYRSLGFVDIPAYRNNPIEGAVFLELALATGENETVGEPRDYSIS